jgi:hypothetical protein
MKFRGVIALISNWPVSQIDTCQTTFVDPGGALVLIDHEIDRDARKPEDGNYHANSPAGHVFTMAILVLPLTLAFDEMLRAPMRVASLKPNSDFTPQPVRDVDVGIAGKSFYDGTVPMFVTVSH